MNETHYDDADSDAGLPDDTDDMDDELEVIRPLLDRFVLSVCNHILAFLFLIRFLVRSLESA